MEFSFFFNTYQGWSGLAASGKNGKIPPSFRWGTSLRAAQIQGTHMQGMWMKEKIFTALIVLGPGKRWRAFWQLSVWWWPSLHVSLPFTLCWLEGTTGNCMFSEEPLYQISIYKYSAYLCSPYAAQRDEAGTRVCSYIFQISFFFFPS